MSNSPSPEHEETAKRFLELILDEKREISVGYINSRKCVAVLVSDLMSDEESSRLAQAIESSQYKSILGIAIESRGCPSVEELNTDSANLLLYAFNNT